MEHTYGTRCSTQNCVSINKVNTICYGKKSIKFNSAKTWNYLQNALNVQALEVPRAKAMKMIRKRFIETYMDTWSLSEINIIKFHCLPLIRDMCYIYNIYVYVYVHVGLYMYICIYVCICMYVYIYIYIYIYSLHIYTFICFCYFLFVCLFIYLIYLFIYLFILLFLFGPLFFSYPHFSNFSQNDVCFNKQFCLNKRFYRENLLLLVS